MEIIQIILSLGIILAVGLLISFYKKKGENLATKQDIAEITHKIEAVKSKLQISTNSEIDFRRDQKKSILEFYDAFIYWYADVLEVANSNIDNERVKEIATYNDKIDDAYKKVIISSRRLELYISDDVSLHNITTSLRQLGLKVEKQTSKFLMVLEGIYEELNELQAAFKSGININEELHTELLKKEIGEWAEISLFKSKVNKDVENILKEFIEITKQYVRGN